MAREQKKGTVCIFGTGDFGCSLGLRLVQAGYKVIFGSRDPKKSTRVPKVAKVMTHTDAAQMAQVIFIAVQRDHYKFLSSLTPALEGKVLVDISNNLKRGQFPQSNAEYLSSLVPGASVVKGFNTVSAWALQSGTLDASRQVLVCGDDPRAKLAVVDIAHSLGLTAQDRGPLRAAGELEDIPLRLFPNWRLPLGIAVGLTAFFILYLLVHDIIYSYVEKKQDRFYRIMISLPNNALPCVALIMLSLCYLPSIFAAILQLHNGTKYKRFPDWLDRWMLCRKQLGLLALALASLHVLYIYVEPIRYSEVYDKASDVIKQIKNNKTEPFDYIKAWRSETYKTFGVLGFALFLLLGITSLPSVSNALNWREFRFVQSRLGHLTLVLCTAHCLTYGWDRFLDPRRYHWYTPPSYMLALVVPCALLVLKFIIITPCIDRRVTRIRHGQETLRNNYHVHTNVYADNVTSL